MSSLKSKGGKMKPTGPYHQKERKTFTRKFREKSQNSKEKDLKIKKKLDPILIIIISKLMGTSLETTAFSVSATEK